MPSASALLKLRKIAQLKAAMIDAVRHGALMYCNGEGGRPIVDQHFTEGNQQRYGWQPLSAKYFLWKHGQLPAKGANFRGSKLDQKASAIDKHGKRIVGRNLPMLVLTGALRQAENSKQHTVVMRGGNAIITFRNLPEYAEYHHTGTARLPKRSPVNPNAMDRKLVIEYMKAYLRRTQGLQPNKRTV